MKVGFISMTSVQIKVYVFIPLEINFKNYFKKNEALKNVLNICRNKLLKVFLISIHKYIHKISDCTIFINEERWKIDIHSINN